MTTDHPSARDRMVVLRRQPVRIVGGQPEGGYTSLFEIICCYCGDHPDLDYREVPPELQQIRGPYPIAVAVAAYEEHLRLHEPEGRLTSWLAETRTPTPTIPDPHIDQNARNG